MNFRETVPLMYSLLSHISPFLGGWGDKVKSHCSPEFEIYSPCRGKWDEFSSYLAMTTLNTIFVNVSSYLAMTTLKTNFVYFSSYLAMTTLKTIFVNVSSYCILVWLSTTVYIFRGKYFFKVAFLIAYKLYWKKFLEDEEISQYLDHYIFSL